MNRRALVNRNIKLHAKYEELKKREYLLTDNIIVALWEFIIECRPEEKNRLQAIRIEIKNKYPKK